MALFKKRNKLLVETPLPVKRGRGRPRKIEQIQQGSDLNTQIVQPQVILMQKLRLPANKKWLYIGLVIIIAIIPTIYFYTQNKNATNKLNDLQSKSQNASNLDEVVKQVGKLVIVPSDEKPTLATISDISKLKGQEFFANAANGDKVLVYQKAGKAIIYRPSLNLVVEMAPLNSNTQPSQ